MISYIKADFYRFSKKKSFAVLLGLFTLGFTTLMIVFRDKIGFAEALVDMLISMSPVLVSIAIFTAVYSDDINAHALQIPIGNGLTRIQVVFAKLLETILLNMLVFVYAGVHLIVLNTMLSNNFEYAVYFPQLFSTFLSIIVYSSFASIIIYKTQKTSIGTGLVTLLMLGFIDQLLTLLPLLKIFNSIFPNFIGYIPTQLVFKLSQNGIMLDKVLILLIYIVINTIVSILVFSRTELEF